MQYKDESQMKENEKMGDLLDEIRLGEDAPETPELTDEELDDFAERSSVVKPNGPCSCCGLRIPTY